MFKACAKSLTFPAYSFFFQSCPLKIFSSNPWIGGQIELILNFANLVDGKVQWEIECSHGERLKHTGAQYFGLVSLNVDRTRSGILVHIYYVLFSIGWLFSKMLFNKYIADIFFEISYLFHSYTTRANLSIFSIINFTRLSTRQTINRDLHLYQLPGSIAHFPECALK